MDTRYLTCKVSAMESLTRARRPLPSPTRGFTRASVYTHTYTRVLHRFLAHCAFSLCSLVIFIRYSYLK